MLHHASIIIVGSTSNPSEFLDELANEPTIKDFNSQRSGSQVELKLQCSEPLTSRFLLEMVRASVKYDIKLQGTQEFPVPRIVISISRKGKDAGFIRRLNPRLLLSGSRDPGTPSSREPNVNYHRSQVLNAPRVTTNLKRQQASQSSVVDNASATRPQRSKYQPQANAVKRIRIIGFGLGRSIDSAFANGVTLSSVFIRAFVWAFNGVSIALERLLVALFGTDNSQQNSDK
jgi:hypothetical protein